MANGGIPVSGGESGHGTLISTNLLYSPLLLDTYGPPLARPSYALSGTAGAAGYEAAFVADKDSKTLWKTPASSADQSLTMIHGANPPTVYGAVIVGHNIAAAAVSLAKLEGGMDTNYNTVSEDLVFNVATLTPAYHLLASPQAYDHWRIRVNFVASTALQIGEVFLIGAPPITFAKNYQWKPVDDVEIGKVSNMGISGVPRISTRWVRKRMDITFQEITTTQLTAMQAAAQNGHVIFSPEGSSSFAYFGIWEIEPPTHVYFDAWNVVAHFTECPK